MDDNVCLPMFGVFVVGFFNSLLPDVFHFINFILAFVYFGVILVLCLSTAELARNCNKTTRDNACPLLHPLLCGVLGSVVE